MRNCACNLCLQLKGRSKAQRKQLATVYHHPTTFFTSSARRDSKRARAYVSTRTHACIHILQVTGHGSGLHEAGCGRRAFVRACRCAPRLQHQHECTTCRRSTNMNTDFGAPAKQGTGDKLHGGLCRGWLHAHHVASLLIQYCKSNYLVTVARVVSIRESYTFVLHPFY